VNVPFSLSVRKHECPPFLIFSLSAGALIAKETLKMAFLAKIKAAAVVAAGVLLLSGGVGLVCAGDEPTPEVKPRAFGAELSEWWKGVKHKADAAGEVVWQGTGIGGRGSLRAVAISAKDPKVVYVGGDVEGLFKTTDAGKTWGCLNGALGDAPSKLTYRFVHSIAIHPDNPEVAYFGFGGLYKTTDGGKSFVYLTPHLEKESVFPCSLVLDPGNPDRIYLGLTDVDTPAEWCTRHGEVHFSPDGGRTWKVLHEGIPAKAQVYAIAVDANSPEEGRTVYTATDKGVYKSTDGGQTWKGKRTGNFWGIVVTPMPGGRKRVLALERTARDPLVASDDEGETWKSPESQPGAVGDGKNKDWYYRQLLIHPRDPEQMLVTQQNGGLWETRDGGKTWKNICPKILEPQEEPVDNCWTWWHMAYAPSDPNVLYAACIGGCLRTTDGGKSWEVLHNDVLGEIEELRGRKRGNLELGDWWAVTETASTLWYKTRGLNLQNMRDITITPDGKAVYVASDDFRILKTYDGEKWQRLGRRKVGGLPQITCATVDPQYPESIYCGTRGDGGERAVYRSDDGGWDWRRVSQDGSFAGNRDLPSKGCRMSDILMDPRPSPKEQRVLFIAAHHNGVYMSKDSGSTWENIGSGLPAEGRSAWQLALEPGNPGVLYAGLTSYPPDGTQGRMWTGGHAGDKPGNLWKTSDCGKTWNRVNEGLDLHCIVSFSLDPRNPRTIYAANHGPKDSEQWDDGVFRSNDGGKSWEKLFSKGYTNLVAVSPWDSNVIYAASALHYTHYRQQPGMYRSSDGGKTWKAINLGLTNHWIYCIEFDPIDPHKLYVGTCGSGPCFGWDPDPQPSVRK
jgi:photosystem II stability/assembly factor-like uncharacterized protein